MTPEAMETSNEVVAEGLFNMGIILKNKLEDYPAAIANFNLLEERFPRTLTDSTYTITCTHVHA